MAFAAYTGEAVQPAGDNSKASQLGKMRCGLSLGKVSTIRFSVLVILIISSPLCLQSFRTFCSVTGSDWQDDSLRFEFAQNTYEHIIKHRKLSEHHPSFHIHSYSMFEIAFHV